MSTLLKGWMLGKKLSHRDFSDLIEVSRPFLTQLVNGHYPDIKISLLRRISEVTKIPMKSIVQDLLKDRK